MTRITCLCLISVSALTGCRPASEPQDQNISVDAPSSDVSDESHGSGVTIKIPQFPMEIGARWEYEIRVTKIEPLEYRTWLRWRYREPTVVSSRGRFSGYDPKRSPPTYALEIAAKRRSDKAGPFQFEQGIEMSIERDELGVFQEAKTVFWGVDTAPKSDPFSYVVEQVILYPNDTLYRRPIIFSIPGSNTEGKWIATPEQRNERIVYISRGKTLDGFEGQDVLHFRRMVVAGKDDVLGKAFHEDMWFAPGKGLVRLEQRIQNKPSMTWILKRFVDSSQKGSP